MRRSGPAQRRLASAAVASPPLLGAQACIDDLNNKLAGLIANAELLSQMVDGDAAERVDRLIHCAWQAARVVEKLDRITTQTLR